MKEAWIRPVTEVQQFMANEYVAACGGDAGVVYYFNCNAGNASWGKVYQVFVDGTEITNQNGQGKFSPCGEKHEASSLSEFVQGKIHYYNNPIEDTTYDEDVIIWRGEDGTKIHCTTALDMKTWEVVRS